MLQELVIKVAAGAKSIRVPLGEGIAGHVGAKYVPAKPKPCGPPCGRCTACGAHARPCLAQDSAGGASVCVCACVCVRVCVWCRGVRLNIPDAYADPRSCALPLLARTHAHARPLLRTHARAHSARTHAQWHTVARFDSHHDNATGYKTQSILCHPVRMRMIHFRQRGGAADIRAGGWVVVVGEEPGGRGDRRPAGHQQARR